MLPANVQFPGVFQNTSVSKSLFTLGAGKGLYFSDSNCFQINSVKGNSLMLQANVKFSGVFQNASVFKSLLALGTGKLLQPFGSYIFKSTL